MMERKNLAEFGRKRPCGMDEDKKILKFLRIP
jgi:hypothetical protein